MKLTILLFAAILFCKAGISQTIGEGREKEFKEKYDALWSEYDAALDSIIKLGKVYPEKKDSLKTAYNDFSDKTFENCIELSLNYADTKGGLLSLYRLRNRIDKKILLFAYNKLPPEIKQEPYAESVRLHIELEQVSEGGLYVDFTAKTISGDNFSLSSIVENKDVLLIFDGLDCMGKENRDTLSALYKKIDRSLLEIVSVLFKENKEAFESYYSKYKISWICVSDFKSDHGFAKIAYGAQAKPTCFYIKKGGLVEIKCLGVEGILAKLNSLIN